MVFFLGFSMFFFFQGFSLNFLCFFFLGFS